MSAVSYGYENPQTPSMISEIFMPDQLIAGRFFVVTGEVVSIAGVSTMLRGTVLGQQTLPTATVVAKAGNTGTGTVGSVSLGEFAPLGNYVLTATSATEFTVTAPNGDNLGMATVGVLFDNQIEFMITAGTTAFAAGDMFTIEGAQGSGDFVLCVATATDGSQMPAAILADTASPMAGAPVNGAVYYTGEFNLNAMTWDPSWTSAALAPKLRAVNIYTKNSVSAAMVTSNA